MTRDYSGMQQSSSKIVADDGTLIKRLWTWPKLRGTAVRWYS